MKLAVLVLMRTYHLEVIKKRRTAFAQLRSSFSALADNVKKIHCDERAAESLSLLVSNLSNYLCGTTTDLSEKAVGDVFQRAMKDTSPSTKTAMIPNTMPRRSMVMK